MKLYLTKTKFFICFFNCRHFASKNKWKILKKDTEIYDLSSNKSKSNFLAVYGVAGTGALGLKNLINDERPNGNLVYARRPYPFYYFNWSNDSPNISIKSVAAGYGFTLFSGKNSKYGWQIYGCGVNSNSQLGYQPKASIRNDIPILMEPKPINIPATLNNISHIASGRAHSVVVADIETSENNCQMLYLFGNNVLGQCCRQIIENEIYSNSAVIHGVQFPKRIKQVECGESTTLILAEDGTVYGCGSNIYGQLANKESHCSTSFIQITNGLEEHIITQISCRSNTILALTSTGTIYAWGNNDYGTIVGDIDSAVTSPRLIEMPNTSGKVIQVSTGNSICAVLDDEGHVYTWGLNYVGHGPSVTMLSYPTMIHPNLFGGGLSSFNKETSKVVQVKCGLLYNVAILSSGSVFIWGDNCVLKNKIQTFPVRLPLSFKAKRAFMGADHMIIMGGNYV